MTRYKIETNDIQEHLQHLMGQDYLLVLWDYSQWLRKCLKYNSKGFTGEQLEALTEVRDVLFEMMESRNIDFNILE